MLNKNEAKYIQSLSLKKHRDASGHFLVEGIKGVDELLNSNFSIKKLYALQDWAHLKQDKAPLVKVSADELKKISGLQTPNQVLAIVAQKIPQKAGPEKGKLVIALDGIQDPGNMGTLIRIADWFGIDTILAGADSADFYSPKVIQSTMGSFSRVRVCYGNLYEMLAASPVPIYGALLRGSSIYQNPTVKEGVLLIGNESNGIHQSIQELITHPVHIPRIGGAESLNAAVAAGILLSHLIKK